MPRDYPYLISSLPILHFDQPDEVDATSTLEHIEDNLLPRDRTRAYFLREQIDLMNLQAALMGRVDFLPHGRFSRDQLLLESEDADVIPLLWQDYVPAFRAGDQPSIECLWIEYFERGALLGSSLLWMWSESECALRVALAILRAQRLERSLDDLEALEHPLVEEMIANARLPDLGVTYRFPWAVGVREALERENPLETERILDLLRWRLIDEEVGLVPFGADTALGYFLKLLILSRWMRINQLEGYDRLCKEVLGGQFIA